MTRVKICGITSVEDALAAVRSGADALGFNFYPRSPRCLSQERAAEIVRGLPPFVERVALFVNETFDHMRALAERIGRVNTLQYHAETPPLCPADTNRYIPAFRVKDADSLKTITVF